MNRAGLFISTLAGLSLLAAASHAAAPAVRYVDAHGHLIEGVSPEEELAVFRQAGVAGVVMMFPDTGVLLDAARKNPGYVVPFNSIARTPQMKGLRLEEATATTLARLYDAGEICGFGEVPTRLDPNPEPNDAAAIGNRFRTQMLDVANDRGAPVNFHVSLETPEVVAAVEQQAAAHPKAKLVLAHAGWISGADVMDRLMSAHANIYADLSIRLLPPRNGGPAETSILTADGALQPEWRTVIERHPDRFMFGIDVSAQSYTRVAEMLAVARRAFAVLPRQVEEAVAHGNVESLVKGCRSGLNA